MPPAAEGKLAILCGGGALPRKIIAQCLDQGRPLFLAELADQPDRETLELADRHGIERARFALGAAGAVIAGLKARQVSTVTLAGSVRRPSLAELKPDLRAAGIIAKIGFGKLGDDGLLRAIADVLEAEGMQVISPASLLPRMLAGDGVLGRHAPDQAAYDDIDRGWRILAALGGHDVGQAVAVQQGMILAVEAAEGTDAMLARAGGLRRDGAGPVLIKSAKTGQDSRLDPPVIGRDTISCLAGAGFQGAALGAGQVMILDPEAVIEAADAAGLFLYGVPA